MLVMMFSSKPMSAKLSTLIPHSKFYNCFLKLCLKANTIKYSPYFLVMDNVTRSFSF